MPKVTSFNKKKFLEKYVLKKTTAFVLTGVTAIGVSSFLIKNHFDIEVPKEYTYKAVDVDINHTYKVDEEKKDDIVFIKTTDWKKGLNETTVKNVETCNNNNIPCGIIMESTSDNVKDANSDAAIIKSTLDGYNIDCAIYYDVNHLKEKTDETFNEICSSFENEIGKEYRVAYLGDSDSLLKLNEDKQDNGNILVTDDKTISTKVGFDVCYFTRTKDYYSKDSFSKTISSTNNVGDSIIEYKQDGNKESSYDDIVLSKDGKYVKGVDVSKHQGIIDWKEFKNQGVGFAIIRYSGFLGYKDNGIVKVDEQFENNVKGCLENDIPFGIYYYSTARTVQQAKNEANEMSKIIGEYENIMSLPLYMDIEAFSNEAPLDYKETAKWYKAAKDVLKEAHPNLDVALYASKSLYNDMCNYNPSIKSDKDWVAVYPNDSIEKKNGLSFNNITEDNVKSDGTIVQISQYGLLDGAYQDKGNPGGTLDINVMTTDSFEEMTVHKVR